MELDFDRFIQSHFSQLDVLENARARDNSKGTSVDHGARVSNASFCYEKSGIRSVSNAPPVDSCIEFAEAINISPEADVEAASLVADKSKSNSDGEENDGAVSSQVDFYMTCQLFPSARIVRDVANRLPAGSHAAARFSAA